MFEPRLAGLQQDLEKLQQLDGHELTATWARRAKYFSGSLTVASIALILNEIAGLHYNRGEKRSANYLCQCAWFLCSSALGVDHPHTKIISDNLEGLQPSKDTTERLPKLRNFNKKK